MTIPSTHGRRRLNSPPRRRWRLRWEPIVGVLLIAAAAYSAGTTYATGEESAERGECQARVNAQVVRALQVRDDANREITDAQRRLVVARLDGASTGATPRQADQAYLRSLDSLTRVRNANPIEGAQTC